MILLKIFYKIISGEKTVTNLLIVGGCGSIGQNLIEIIPKETPIFVLDKILCREYTSSCKYFQCDLTDVHSIDLIASKLPNDLIVVYLAGNLITSITKEAILNSVRDNITALVNFMTSISSKLKHLIYVSSLSVYGIPKYVPVDEDHPINPSSIYGSEKACGELISKSLCNLYKIPLTIIRSTQLFGLSSAEQTLPHILLNRLKLKENVKILCDPNCERDYLHVSDFSRFIFEITKTPIEGIFNMGGGRGIKILDLFRSSFDTFGIPFDPKKTIDIQSITSYSIVLNIEKAHHLYGFRPKYTIEEWFKDNAKDNIL